MKFNRDCVHFLGSKPCEEHKERGILCETCDKYKQIKSRILIIKLDALGDVLRTTSILPALHKKYPGAAVTWLTRGNAIPLLRNNPWIYRIWALEDNYLEYLLNQRFDIAFCLDADLLAGSVLNLSQATKKYGFTTKSNGYVVPVNKNAETWYCMGLDDTAKKENRKTFFEHLYQICDLPFPVHRPQYLLQPEQLEIASAFKEEKNLTRFKTIVGINTGGGKRWQMKKWIQSSIIALIQNLKAYKSDVGILLYGGHEETQYNIEIMKAVGKDVIDTGCQNSLDKFAALASLSDIFLTPDSLGMHISIALGKTTLVLVGPTSPWELDVFENGEIIFSDLACIACYKNLCDLESNCMEAITPEIVLEKILRYVRRRNNDI